MIILSWHICFVFLQNLLKNYELASNTVIHNLEYRRKGNNKNDLYKVFIDNKSVIRAITLII
jgi:hypothetical protein